MKLLPLPMTSIGVLDRLLSSVDYQYGFTPFDFRLFVDFFHGFNNRNLSEVCIISFTTNLSISKKDASVFLKFATSVL